MLSVPVEIPDATSRASPRSGAETESRRLMSLDALRGFDMFWILGADSLVAGLRGLNANPVTNLLATQLDHAEWEGFHFYDLIFPLFVFMMGISTVFSLAKIIEREGRGAAVKRVLRRGVLLFIVALVYSGGFTNPWPDMRLMGVLNRIAICYTCGGLLFIFLPVRALMAICAALLLGYWAMMRFVPIRDIQLEKNHLAALAENSGDKVLAEELRNINNSSARNPSAIKDSPVWAAVRKMYDSTTNRVTGKFDMGYNVSCHFDFEHLPARKYDIFWDPEGLLSTIPAIATGLLGIFAGLFITKKEISDERKVAWLLGVGAVAVVAGFLWGMEFPVIKKIWTSSYVLVAGGYSAILLGAFYWAVEIKKYRAWCRPFVWIGMNPITLYLASNFMGGLGFEKLAARLAGGPVKSSFDAHVTPGFGQLIISAIAVALFLWFAHFLYRRKIFLRF